MVYTKEEFKKEWSKKDCKITFDDIADCAKAWGISSNPKIRPIHQIRYLVVKAAGCPDAEEWNPDNEEED